MHCTVHFGWRGEGTEGRHPDIPQIVESLQPADIGVRVCPRSMVQSVVRAHDPGLRGIEQQVGESEMDFEDNL